jgi:hypothetical protein
MYNENGLETDILDADSRWRGRGKKQNRDKWVQTEEGIYYLSQNRTSFIFFCLEYLHLFQFDLSFLALF